ncbi:MULTISPECIES: hypothetical protein, partial [Eubacteriales]|uniref:hypothetical protein n=1 Tax=Eubacteriales TaxID=186802 RepID=UPI001AA111A5
MPNPKLFTVGAVTADSCVQTVIVDGCKVTLRFNQQSNLVVLHEIKSILSTALISSTSGKILQKQVKYEII